MEIVFKPEEVTLLSQVLKGYLSDLRMEIADTEDYDMRQSLKQEEATLKSLISRLEKADLAA